MRNLFFIFGLFSLPLAAEPISSGEQWATTIATLVFVLALILVLGFFARKLNLPTKLVGQIRLIASLPLGAKERVAVIEVGEQQYLVGISSGGIQLLDKLEAPIEPPQGADFSKVLSRVNRGAK